MRARVAAAALCALASLGGEARADLGQLRRAHNAILQLDVEDAHRALETASPDDPDSARALALLAIYEGDCDLAVSLLLRHAQPASGSLGGAAEVARGCARVTASTTIVRDDVRGIILRIKDDTDLPLAPFLFEIADKALVAVERDLGVRLPRPLRIEIVPDHHSLAAMTGLPEEAAQTTGTVAVAKWGRVVMLTPRAAPHGYPWADTLMHELTHLAITRASRDRAPLWLQEGVAKREETRWRKPSVLDDVPTPESIAKQGFERGTARPLDKLGPSIAMLPTPEQAMVAFAEVHSFIRFWTKENGDGALPRLLVGLADATGEDPVDATLNQVSGAGLSGWNDRWRASLGSAPPIVEEAPSRGAGAKSGERDAHKAARLGDLLADRGHHAAAAPYLARTVKLVPRDPSARARLAHALRALGRGDEAAKVLGALAEVSGPHGLYFAMRGASQRDAQDLAGAEEAFQTALENWPFQADVACEALPEASFPQDPARAAICAGARISHRR